MRASEIHKELIHLGSAESRRNSLPLGRVYQLVTHYQICIHIPKNTHAHMHVTMIIEEKATH